MGFNSVFKGLSRSVYTLPLAILGYIKNGILERTACLHRSLLQRKNATNTFYKLKVDFGVFKMGRTHVLDWVSKFKNGVTPAETCRKFGTPTDEQNR